MPFMPPFFFIIFFCLNEQIMAKSMKKSMKKKSAMKSMKKAMKSMKKKGGMKGMKRKAKRVSKVAKGRGAKARVFRGKKARTSGGLKKSDLTKKQRRQNRVEKTFRPCEKKVRKERPGEVSKSGHGGTQSPWHQGFSGCWWQVCQRPGAFKEGTEHLQKVGFLKQNHLCLENQIQLKPKPDLLRWGSVHLTLAHFFANFGNSLGKS